MDILPNRIFDSHSSYGKNRKEHILQLIAQEKSNKEVAKELFISNRTVDTHRNNLMRKLNISPSVHLVHYAYSNGLI